MCGIVGLFATNQKQEVVLSQLIAMSQIIAHRGPDGDGHYIGPGVGLGHRRLAIIDLSLGQQPFFTPNKDFVLVYNGELYNYKEIRHELQLLGHNFRTSSDTEVVMHAWIEWGSESLIKFRGMFAFALYDAKKDTLTLARDRFGIKPLFIGRLTDGTIGFASELKALSACLSMSKTKLDPKAVADFFLLGYVPDQRSIFASVRKLPPATFLTLTRGESLPNPVQYWRIDFSQIDVTQADALERTRSVVSDSVKAHLVSDVSVSAFLSGGIDSGIVTSSMALAGSNTLAHTIDFTDEKFSERALATAVAQRYGLKQNIATAALPAPHQVVSMLQHFDEPFADQSAIPTDLLCSLAAKESKVALSGDGGDESFGGYNWYMSAFLRQRIANLVPRFLRSGLGKLAKLAMDPRWPQSFRPRGAGHMIAAVDLHKGLVLAQALAPWLDSKKLFSVELLRELQGYDPIEYYAGIARQAPSDSYYRQAQYLDMQLYLPGDILTKVDRLSMRHGLEVRVPFLDNLVFDWVCSLPTETVFLNGERKGLLKQTALDLLPKSVVNAPKRGFSVPLDSWFDSGLGENLSKALEKPSDLLRASINVSYARYLLNLHLTGKARLGPILFALLSFSVFCNRNWLTER